MNKKMLGAWGEEIAKKYLENKGYIILEKNWRHHYNEIDIIAYKNKIIAFEVKTRKTRNNLPFTVLKSQQVNRLRLSLRAYCLLNKYNYNYSRLDLILITIKAPNRVILKHHLDI